MTDHAKTTRLQKKEVAYVAGQLRSVNLDWVSSQLSSRKGTYTTINFSHIIIELSRQWLINYA